MLHEGQPGGERGGGASRQPSETTFRGPTLSVTSRCAANTRHPLDDTGVAQEQLARIEASIGSIRLTRIVLRRAALPMATVVCILDAPHLPSVLLSRERRNVALL